MKLTLEQFKQYIELTKTQHKASTDVYATLNLFVDELKGVVELEAIKTFLEQVIFNELQYDYITWWLYDAPNGISQLAVENANVYEPDSDNVIACLDSVEALYNYIKVL